jgi:hypothetical protein
MPLSELLEDTDLEDLTPHVYTAGPDDTPEEAARKLALRPEYADNDLVELDLPAHGLGAPEAARWMEEFDAAFEEFSLRYDRPCGLNPTFVVFGVRFGTQDLELLHAAGAVVFDRASERDRLIQSARDLLDHLRRTQKGMPVLEPPPAPVGVPARRPGARPADYDRSPPGRSLEELAALSKAVADPDRAG